MSASEKNIIKATMSAYVLARDPVAYVEACHGFSETRMTDIMAGRTSDESSFGLSAKSVTECFGDNLITMMNRGDYTGDVVELDAWTYNGDQPFEYGYAKIVRAHVAFATKDRKPFGQHVGRLVDFMRRYLEDTADGVFAHYAEITVDGVTYDYYPPQTAVDLCEATPGEIRQRRDRALIDLPELFSSIMRSARDEEGHEVSVYDE